jgi:signal transduction histidine kinase
MNSEHISDTNRSTPTRLHPPGLASFLTVGVSAMLVGLALFYLAMQPSAQDLTLMVELMGITTVISITLSFFAMRLGWIFNFTKLRYTLFGGYLLAGLMVFFDVWITARFMFTSPHDLLLATILLVFASVMAVATGYFLSEGLIQRIRQLQDGASRVAAGELTTRVTARGRDEMARLAQSFNEMVKQLEESERKKRELDVLRRDLIAWVGHDLRTPLTSIRAIVEALADGMVEDEIQRNHYLNTARADIRSLSDLIDDLFEMSQLDAGGLKLEKVSVVIDDLVADSLELFSPQAQKAGVRLEGLTEPGTAPVKIDAQQIGRVIANLMSNAIHHTPRGGVVSIQAQRKPAELFVQVKDTGEGIQPEDLPHVFEQFFRAEASRSRVSGGSGLGLAIAKGIVELHGGTIGIASQPEQGTEVWFRIPQ